MDHERFGERLKLVGAAREARDPRGHDDSPHLDDRAVREREPESARDLLDARYTARVDGKVGPVAEPVCIGEKVVERQWICRYEPAGLAPARER